MNRVLAQAAIFQGVEPAAADALIERLHPVPCPRGHVFFTDVSVRVAKQLLLLARQFGVQESGAVRVVHDLTQEELGHLVGSSRETVNKALSDFAQRGWIRLEGKSVGNTDSERLASRARG